MLNALEELFWIFFFFNFFYWTPHWAPYFSLVTGIYYFYVIVNATSTFVESSKRPQKSDFLRFLKVPKSFPMVNSTFNKIKIADVVKYFGSIQNQWLFLIFSIFFFSEPHIGRHFFSPDTGSHYFYTVLKSAQYF